MYCEPPDLGLCVNLTILIAEHGLGNLDGGCVRARDLELGVEHLPPVLTGQVLLHPVLQSLPLRLLQLQQACIN